jgi:hypothetical protein
LRLISTGALLSLFLVLIGSKGYRAGLHKAVLAVKHFCLCITPANTFRLTSTNLNEEISMLPSLNAAAE